MSRFLLVEDDELVGTMVLMNLQTDRDQVVWAKTGTDALREATASRFDLVLLDITLPGMEGTEVLKRMRAAGVHTPVLMLTARFDTNTKVKAFSLGADDYLSKPFDVLEMVARVGALLRRSRAERLIPTDRMVRVGPVEVNLETRTVHTPSGEAQLGEKESAILDILVRASPLPVTRADILDEVWGMDAYPTERTVDNYLLTLRKLIEPDPANPVHILTVRGTGYRFQP